VFVEAHQDPSPIRRVGLGRGQSRSDRALDGRLTVIMGKAAGLRRVEKNMSNLLRVEVTRGDEAAEAIGGGVEGVVALPLGGVGDAGGFAGEGDLAVTAAAGGGGAGASHGLPDLVGSVLFGLPLLFEESGDPPG
jgi:hypothetical protein